MDDALVIRNLSKSYPDFLLREVSFRLPRGYIMGLIGPNGAGKTTIIKLILNLVRRDDGQIAVLGRDNIADETWIKQRIGFVHETPAFYGHLTVRRTASLAGRFYDAWDDGRFRRLAGEFGLPLGKRVGRLSRGMKMKLALALALSHGAEFLLLDEPTSGLDPVFRRELLATLSGLLQDGRTSVLFSTHITSDLERPADFITFLLDGEVVFSSSREALRDSWILVKGGGDLLDECSRPLFRAVRETPFGFQGLSSRGAEVRRLLGEERATYEKPTLDEIVFLMSKES
ncbi:MAG: ABC transporter ATP-binding protein [Candidatus Aminicenantes bacterium]|nr:ABC transporter ATP-binding protein [Candidatus Aminicenantes bacterium]